MTQLKEFLYAGLERVHGFSFGDSHDQNKKSKWLNFTASLKKVLVSLSVDLK